VSRGPPSGESMPGPRGVKRTASVRLLPRRRSRPKLGRLGGRFPPGTGVTMVRKPSSSSPGRAARSDTASSRACLGTAGDPSSPSTSSPSRAPSPGSCSSPTRLDPRRQLARAHPVGVRGGPRVPPGGAAFDAGEFTPTTAHQVNVEGMLGMLEFAQKEGESHGRPVLFLYPSSIAAYGMPDRDEGAGGEGEGGRLEASPPPCTGATSSTASTSGATTSATTSSSRRSPSRERWTSARCASPGSSPR